MTTKVAIGTVSHGIAPTMDDARAAGLDAGNRSMRKGGRVKWDKSDYDAATKVYLEVARLVLEEGVP